MLDFTKQFSTLTTVSACLEKRDQLASSGRFAEIKSQIATTSSEEKKVLGAELNKLRLALQQACDQRIQEIQIEQEKDVVIEFDPTFYSEKYKQSHGQLHPLTQIEQEVISIFEKMGFGVFDGEQVETQWYNFTSVGTPDYHPARGMQDTFFVKQKDESGEHYVMRTQVTANICRYAETHKPPFRVIFPGIVFRAENIDATHDINFHQFDMWLVDEKGKSGSISQLVTLIQVFFSEFFNDPDLKVRLRPSYFPFTQPSFEGDIYSKWFKGGRWIEVFGAGPIHTQVIKNMGLDPNKWEGLAFGFGLSRLAQLKLKITGISQFYNNNLSFIKGKTW